MYSSGFASLFRIVFSEYFFIKSLDWMFVSSTPPGVKVLTRIFFSRQYAAKYRVKLIIPDFDAAYDIGKLNLLLP